MLLKYSSFLDAQTLPLETDLGWVLRVQLHSLLLARTMCMQKMFKMYTYNKIIFILKTMTLCLPFFQICLLFSLFFWGIFLKKIS